LNIQNTTNKMNPKEFVEKYKPDAIKIQQQTGMLAEVILAQAAWESGWGKYVPGNMFFGVKDTDGINGNEQLITTTEYHRTANVKYPVVISIVPVMRNGKKLFKYKVKDYFRKFENPADSFEHHVIFLLNNKRYSKAMVVRNNAELFLKEIAKAGYATDPNYEKNMLAMAKKIRKIILNEL